MSEPFKFEDRRATVAGLATGTGMGFDEQYCQN